MQLPDMKVRLPKSRIMKPRIRPKQRLPMRSKNMARAGERPTMIRSGIEIIMLAS
jgi:hypothetical protein